MLDIRQTPHFTLDIPLQFLVLNFHFSAPGLVARVAKGTDFRGCLGNVGRGGVADGYFVHWEFYRRQVARLSW